MECRNRCSHLPVQVSTASDFSTGIVVDDSTLTAASKALTSSQQHAVLLAGECQECWRLKRMVLSFQLYHNRSSVRSTGTFSTCQWRHRHCGKPDANMGAVTGAITYRVQVSTASDFSTGIVVDDSTLTTASKALTPLRTARCILAGECKEFGRNECMVYGI